MRTVPLPQTVPTTRLQAVDNLRVVLTALVVLHHVALTYGNIPMWFYTEPAQDPTGVALDVLVMFNQAFFMGFFFLISGFFTPRSFDRKGGGAFLHDRLLRLGVPLLAFLLVLRPLVNTGYYDGSMPYWKFYLGSWDPGPMWFVEVLLVFAAAYTLWRSTGRRVEERPTTLRPRTVVLFTGGLAAATFAWRLLVPNDTYWPVVGLPTPNFLPQYAALFVAGLFAYRRGWFASLPAGAAKAGLLTAGAVSATILPASILVEGAAKGALTALWESAFAVSMAIGLSVLFRERFGRQGPFGRFLADQAFAVYLIHPVVLVAVGYGLSWLHTAAVVKFAVATVLCLPLCWAAAYALRAIPGVKRVL
ncbi:Acyltransferase family protein [Streptosporangium canum]|uniref:Acyltransferase family protein n=1 Tax=Streptosporangium canum TaxID=324952 RepID=A0A1I4BUM1_9ACTN|nr:acyltransferase family protein [Streptosporangium canum]SFK72488.1 Acyltransferase family protein [Streptosporangium canum]